MAEVDFAARALALVGTRFRAQGRGVGGLDCVGLALAVYGLRAGSMRQNYALRGDHEAEVRAGLRKRFRRVPATQARPGDLVVMKVASDQLHLGIRTELGFVHADARLRRVVETPGAPQWPMLGTYRKRRR